ncbi:MAG TPA: hypothetical protein VK084_05840 [Chitinophagaceae bacterium]|nr:hypothetical protein [Chitinophagaceae bacterium]
MTSGILSTKVAQWPPDYPPYKPQHANEDAGQSMYFCRFISPILLKTKNNQLRR